MDNSSGKQKKVNIAYPDVLSDRKEEILHHQQQQHEKQNIKPDQVLDEEQEEENAQEKHSLPHLNFKQSQGANITMDSLGVRSPGKQDIKHFEQPTEVVEEEEEKDESNQHKIPHIDFSHSNDQKNINFIGKKLDENSPSNRIRTHSNSSLKEIAESEDENVKERNKVRSKSKFHDGSPNSVTRNPNRKDSNQLSDSLNEIEQEIKTLQKDSPSIFRRQKTIDTDIVPPIQENDEEDDQQNVNISPSKFTNHKQNKLGKQLQKLEKELQVEQMDTEGMRQRVNTSDILKLNQETIQESIEEESKKE